MKRTFRSALVAVVAAVALLSLASSASAAATLKNLVNNVAVANGNNLHLRSASDQRLTFAGGGFIKCQHNYAALGSMTVSNNTMTNIWTRVGNSSQLFFGSLLPVNAVAATSCPTTALNPTTCTLQAAPAANGSVPGRLPWLMDARDNRAASNSISLRFSGPGTVFNPGTGAITSLVAVTLQADCVPAGGGAAFRCYYTAGNGPGVNQAVVEGAAPFSGGPSTASTIAFTSQPFYLDTDPGYVPPSSASCPATPPGSPARFSGSLEFFMSNLAAAPQVGAR